MSQPSSHLRRFFFFYNKIILPTDLVACLPQQSSSDSLMTCASSGGSTLLSLMNGNSSSSTCFSFLTSRHSMCLYVSRYLKYARRQMNSMNSDHLIKVYSYSLFSVSLLTIILLKKKACMILISFKSETTPLMCCTS